MAKRQKYFGSWSCHEDMVKDWCEGEYNYNAGKRELTRVDGMASDKEVLFASYEYQDYEGNAYVLFKRDGKLFEVEGGHCSCSGLEGLWNPAQITWKYLASRKVYCLCSEALSLLASLIGKHVKKAN